MLRDPHFIALEKVLAAHLKPLVGELRLTELETFADHVINRREANIAEIVATAAELHFAPGFIHYDQDSALSLDWSGRPSVSLGVGVAAARFNARVRLTIRADHATIELQHLRAEPPASSAWHAVALDRAFAHNSFIARSAPETPPAA
ncbi:MAG: hypothetical protein JJ920_00475 [Roseitalea sp.]|jgi:hypothetical protein|nr:hypothetical protein [Roseitalea sp.]MBO6741352.1 hypothetical protein [Roseitalea sp.]